jgi:uncharacterized BrkB/YihY/UPF0761 family membrane protein
MKRQPTDYLGAFRQLWMLLTILCWVAFVYFMVTGETGSMLQVSKYGRASMGSANVFSALTASLITTVILILLFLPSNNKKKQKKDKV